MLYEPPHSEVAPWAVESALEIRRFLTDQLTRGGIAPELADSLRAMRTACRKFVTVVAATRKAARGPLWWLGFHEALGELRGVVGIHVGQLSVRYGIDVPDPLSSILPLAPDDARDARDTGDPAAL